jgi:hypothetical protein
MSTLRQLGFFYHSKRSTQLVLHVLIVGNYILLYAFETCTPSPACKIHKLNLYVNSLTYEVNPALGGGKSTFSGHTKPYGLVRIPATPNPQG